jgi:hypothetical protein
MLYSVYWNWQNWRHIWEYRMVCCILSTEIARTGDTSGNIVWCAVFRLLKLPELATHLGISYVVLYSVYWNCQNWRHIWEYRMVCCILSTEIARTGDTSGNIVWCAVFCLLKLPELTTHLGISYGVLYSVYWNCQNWRHIWEYRMVFLPKECNTPVGTSHKAVPLHSSVLWRSAGYPISVAPSCGNFHWTVPGWQCIRDGHSERNYTGLVLPVIVWFKMPYWEGLKGGEQQKRVVSRVLSDVDLGGRSTEFVPFRCRRKNDGRQNEVIIG